MENSATAGLVALNGSRRFERAGSLEERDYYGGGLSRIYSQTKAFPQQLERCNLQAMPAGVIPLHHPSPEAHPRDSC